MNKRAQFDLGFGTSQKKKRVRPIKSEKNEIWDRQGGKCYMCPKRLSPTTSHYHHKDGDPSNWRLSNLALVCLECHAIETNRQRIKKVHRVRKEKERREADPLGLGSGNIFGAPKMRKSTKEPNIFGGGDIFGPAPKRRKSENPFGGSIFGGPPKKKRKKKKSDNPFDFGF